jgi:hypothetical protein
MLFNRSVALITAPATGIFLNKLTPAQSKKKNLQKKVSGELLANTLSEKGYSYNWEQVNGRWKILYRACKRVKENYFFYLYI